MLSTTCKFCGLDRKFKNLMYTPTLEAVCISPVKCNNLHPNSLDNIRKRGTVEEFYTYEEALQLAYERTEQTYKHSVSSHSRRLRSINVDTLLQKAISFRVANDMQAEYIAYVMGKLSINKLSQAMHHFINLCMDKDAGFIAEYTARQSLVQYVARPKVEPETPTQKQTVRIPLPPQTSPEDDEEVFEI